MKSDRGDLVTRAISVAVRDSRGNLMMEAILETKADTILEFIRGLRGSLSVTFEEGIGPPGCMIYFYLTSPEWWPASRARMPC